MSDQKTVPSDQDVDAFLATIPHPRRREDSVTLNAIFKEITGFDPVIWGASMVGYGRYDYTYKTGHSGSSLATGFAPRKSSLSLYIMPGYKDYGSILDRLGKHKTGVSCLYVNKLADIDQSVLRELIAAGLADLATRWPVKPR